MSTMVKKFCPDCLNDTFEFVHHPSTKDINEYEVRCAKCHKYIQTDIIDCGFGTNQWGWKDENDNEIIDHFDESNLGVLGHGN